MFKRQPERLGLPATTQAYGSSSRASAFWEVLGAPGTLYLIILVAVLLRVGAAFYLGDEVEPLPGTYDQISYDALARRVLDGHGFTFGKDWWPATQAGEPTAHWSFVYTLFLTAVYGLFGSHPIVARLIQAVAAGILQPWLCRRIGNRLFGAVAGNLAAAASALYAYFIYYAGALMTETFYILAILWILDLALALGSEPWLRRTAKPWVHLGLAIALAGLLRQAFLLFTPILAVWILIMARRGGRRVVAARLALTAVVAAALIVPWTIRNYRAFDRLVVLNTNAGFAFYWGNHPHHGVSFEPILSPDGPSYRDLLPPDLTVLDEAALDQALLRQGIGFVQQDPMRYLKLSLSRAKEYFKFWPSEDSSRISNLSRVASFGLALPFMIVGLFVVIARTRGTEASGGTRGASLLYLFILFYTLLHLASWTLVRYRLPVDAVLMLFAAVGLASLLEKGLSITVSRKAWSERRQPSPRRPASRPGQSQGRQPAGGNL